MDKITCFPPNFSVSRAHKTQEFLSKMVKKEDRLPDQIEFIAGVDVAYIDELAIGAVSVLNYHSLKVIEAETAICEAKMPYVPTLLAFREIPPATACIRKLRKQPDVFLVNGQGIAHPRRCGFVSHLGIVVRKPTIGVANTRLIGDIVNNQENVFVSYNGKILGFVIKTASHGKPVYVSVGHLVSLETATKIVKSCTRDGGIPEPLRQAHITATEHKQQLNKTSNLRKT